MLQYNESNVKVIIYIFKIFLSREKLYSKFMSDFNPISKLKSVGYTVQYFNKKLCVTEFCGVKLLEPFFFNDNNPIMDFVKVRCRAEGFEFMVRSLIDKMLIFSETNSEDLWWRVHNQWRSFIEPYIRRIFYS